ncbi:hypothetical protein BHM03_00051481 [Ensete ventricosum]|nr:hypothetical protein BHM03_00051481 [Ensete ventricosum]
MESVVWFSRLCCGVHGAVRPFVAVLSCDITLALALDLYAASFSTPAHSMAVDVVLLSVASLDTELSDTHRNKVSGRPGRHQWMQSAKVAGSACCSAVSSFPWRSVCTDVCASLRNCDSAVILMNDTGSRIDRITLSSTANSRQSVPTSSGRDMSVTGIVSSAHLIPSGLSQSSLLLSSTSHGFLTLTDAILLSKD